MNIISLVYYKLDKCKSLFYLPSVAALTMLSSGVSAIAETVDTQLFHEASVNAISMATPCEVEVANETFTPVQGTVETSSASLISQSKLTSHHQIAQANIDFGRPSRAGRNYVGIAGNLGLEGSNSSLGDGNVAVVGKVGLTNTISVRPSALFGNNTTILLPVTYDFSLQQPGPFDEPLAIAPYVGVGAALKTGDNSKTALLVSVGLDFPLNSRFTATASANAGFFDQTDIGLLLGVGYNFSGF